MEGKREEFLWGAATSAHQVEGNNIHNDWWAWEKKQPLTMRSGLAADSYKRWREDLALAKQLGHTAYRFSLEWSRIELAPEKWNREAIEHYRQMLLEVRRLGLKSFVTLHHFTNPLWFARRGGWLLHDSPELFARYVRFVAQQLGDLVDFWVTINEPNVYAGKSFWEGTWPPQGKRFEEMARVMNKMVKAHRQAYRIIHAAVPGASVGAANHMIACGHKKVGFSWHALRQWMFNHWFLWRTRGTHDFIGVNYYFPCGQTKTDGQKSDMGWPLYAPGLTDVLVEAKRYGVPVYVTENGLADADDSRRADFIRSHLRAVEAAQRAGVDVRGYLHWSLLDNFEWSDGFAPRFGLVEVDFATQERRVRPSARVYQAIIEGARRR